ncbi:MAG: TetR/AcrR family transcriptional regulator [Acidobacteria bacterium]|nr:TetR/AcrR family transcriptional regulator [Acidobacteriota bacterium]
MPDAAPPLTPKRQEIADAALRLIGRKGIAALTMAALAEELGVTPGAPFRHFASRDEILEAVSQRVEALIGETFPSEELPPLARLEHLFLARASTVGKHAGIARLVFSEQFSLALPPSASARLHRLVKRTRASILDALKEASETGAIRRDIPAEALLTVVVGALQHLVFLGAMASDQARPEAAQEAFQVLIQLLTPTQSKTSEHP